MRSFEVGFIVRPLVGSPIAAFAVLWPSIWPLRLCAISHALT